MGDKGERKAAEAEPTNEDSPSRWLREAPMREEVLPICFLLLARGGDGMDGDGWTSGRLHVFIYF